ncbi:hypothetical protein ACLOJK_011655 [Asimina triloba]
MREVMDGVDRDCMRAVRSTASIGVRIEGVNGGPDMLCAVIFGRDGLLGLWEVIKQSIFLVIMVSEEEFNIGTRLCALEDGT